MGSNTRFAGMPSINIPRSRWKSTHNVTGSFVHGMFVPWEAFPIIPGDGCSVSFKDITRMQTPIAPIFGNIKQSFAAWFVPLRLIWNHAEEFYGANKASSGYPTSTYLLPHARYGEVTVGSLSHYLGKPLKAAADTDADNKAYYIANILKERAYYLIWNEYMRAQQITNPVILDFGDSVDTDSVSSKIGTFNGVSIDPGDSQSLMQVAKEFDYFTASTISTQYGAAVELPLGISAPIIGGGDNFHSITYPNQIKFVTNSGSTSARMEMLGADFPSGGSRGTLGTEVVTRPTSPATVTQTNMIADLTTATAAKVNDVRYAFQLQKYLERANFAGNYFFGILQVHYGVTNPDSRLQRPEFLGKFDESILVHQVVSTADTVNSGVKTSVGATGAVSVTPSGLVHLFDKAFSEPGYVLICRWCKQRQVYSQGVMREDYKKDRYECYSPEFANLGDQATLTREIYWKAGETDIFGYQEHWAEYRYRPDRVTGILDPNGANSLDFWTLANKFTTKPQLNDTFILENRSNLSRALVTAGSQPEYIADTYFEIIWTREMPVYTIPGLIDHFGAL